MKEISILLPSLRPEAVARSIREFSETNSNVDYEIVVVSPFQVSGINTVWIKEEAPRGSVLATQIALRHASADYVMYFSDDVSPEPNCLRNMLDFLKYKKVPFIGAFKMLTPNGREIGPFGCYDKLYACYGCMSKDTIERLGSMFSIEYEYSWCDIDLSLRCWIVDGKVEICPNAFVVPRQINDEVYQNHRNLYWQQDVDTFLNKWHPILGKGYEKNPDKVNRRLTLIK